LVRFNTDGTLDLSFGQGGIARLQGVAPDAIVVGEDGRLIVAGTVPDGSGSARLLADGSLDPTFGNGGTAVAPLSTRAVAVDSSGRVVVAGELDYPCACFIVPADFAAARFDDVGVIDATFGASGLVATDFGGIEDARAMVIQQDGKIVLLGRTEVAPGILLARYNP
jgi:uncharacterized delta-60 repeat protein